MIHNDAISGLFQNFSNLIGEIYGQKEHAERKLKIAEDILDKIYQGHPDIKIAMEKEAKEIAEINAKSWLILSAVSGGWGCCACNTF